MAMDNNNEGPQLFGPDTFKKEKDKGNENIGPNKEEPTERFGNSSSLEERITTAWNKAKQGENS